MFGKLFFTGRLNPLLIASLTLLTLHFAVFPVYENYLRAKTPAFSRALPSFVKTFYRPDEDHEFNLMMLSAIAGYLVMSFLCTCLDLLPLLSLKTQGNKSYFTVREWLDAVSLSLFNMFVSSWFVTLPVFYLHRAGPLRDGTPMMRLDDEFVLKREIINFLTHAFIIDVWFYSTHKVLHWPVFYKSIHKLHHRFKAPTAVASMYANPLEFTIGNVLGVILGPALTNCHPATACFWYGFSLISTGGSHSGYFFFSATNHVCIFFLFNYVCRIQFSRLFSFFNRIGTTNTSITASAYRCSWINCAALNSRDRMRGRSSKRKRRSRCHNNFSIYI